jgi:hypothetical protein
MGLPQLGNVTELKSRNSSTSYGGPEPVYKKRDCGIHGRLTGAIGALSRAPVGQFSLSLSHSRVHSNRVAENRTIFGSNWTRRVLADSSILHMKKRGEGLMLRHQSSLGRGNDREEQKATGTTIYPQLG